MGEQQQDLIHKLCKAFTSQNQCEWINQSDDPNYTQTTFANAPNFIGIIRPKKREFIAKALTFANQNNFHILPVSSNKNWGYGCLAKNAPTLPMVVLDLSNLKGIYPTDKELGLITLEPGVTQEELRTYLDDNQWDCMVPVTGAGPTASVVSNAVERGYGITPHTDHFSACTAMKVFVPAPDMCNEELSSAVSELDNSGIDFIDKSFKWGMGPFIDGLFTQSNLGIVSEMTFRLAKNPSHFSAFYIQIFDPSKFEDSVLFIRKILQTYAGSIGSINLMDRARLLSMTVDNPNIDKDENVFLSNEQLLRLANENQTPEWLIVGSIYGEKAFVSAIKNHINKASKHLGKTLYSDGFVLKAAKFVLNLPFTHFPLMNAVRAKLHKLDQGVDIMLGRPNQVALPLAYWRNRASQPSNENKLHPAHDKCGLLWYAPLIRMNPEVLTEFVLFVRLTMRKFDFDPFITFTNLRHDCIDSTVPIVFNLANEKETQRAKQCLSALIEQGRDKGFVPYRLPTEEQHKLSKNTPYWKCVNKIKQSLDPNGILSPGRYHERLK
ncbi:FAD-binding oxidoreductase [Alteromonas sp. 5E99-2]|uniref:FAD-binding protein n=1 Tax=Alteromonas sp. 5E99-2 TaxID=2817683 RepID=UPI001A984749|nr:FAD-binding protein [Alteromonas sp. 5E99-2]MBO1256531.1 FAD-binding oxidoreductase [Alteromonas sp. 5E99-2]